MTRSSYVVPFTRLGTTAARVAADVETEDFHDVQAFEPDEYERYWTV